MTLREQIADLRRRRGWTQAELARRMGVPQPRVAEIETGEGDPKLSSLERAGSALGAEIRLVRKRA